MSDKPEALRLADFLDDQYDPSHNLEEAADELRRLHQFERGYNEWIEKTQWVQETKQTYELGMHRADVLKQRIEKLETVNQELRKALRDERSHRQSRGASMKLRAFLRGFAHGLTLLPLWRWLRRKT